MTPVRACGGHDGPIAFSVRAGTLPEPRTRSVLIAAGAIRAGVTPRECEAPSVGCGHHPAILGPCAGCATQCMSRSNGFIWTITYMHQPKLIPEAKPACGPPDFKVIETRRPIQPRGFWRARITGAKPQASQMQRTLPFLAKTPHQPLPMTPDFPNSP